MKLYGTWLSHFSRKVRILLDLYAAPYDLIDVGNVAEGPKEKFGGNPLLRVPVLVDGAAWMIDSDHIAEYLVQKLDTEDRFRVRTRDVHDLNIRAVLNGIMAEEVSVILARRTLVPTEKYAVFEDSLDAIRDGLKWLEDTSHSFDLENPGYKEFHLVCFWDHLAYYGLLPMDYEKLCTVVSEVSARNATVRRTAPHILKPKN